MVDWQNLLKDIMVNGEASHYGIFITFSQLLSLWLIGFANSPLHFAKLMKGYEITNM